MSQAVTAEKGLLRIRMRQQRGIEISSVLEGFLARLSAWFEAGCRKLWQTSHRQQVRRMLGRQACQLATHA